MTKSRIKHALISILIGALVAAATVFLEGMIEWLGELENNIAGGSTSAAVYLFRNFPF